ncbi:MAG TPA: histidine kinase, partial [bacterium]|nr:histidine kinase [bacterium]
MAAKKRLRIEIVLHLVFWAGVFYVLTSLNSSHIHVLFKARSFARFAGDQYEEKPVSAYVYIILVFLAALFYGNIFWVFPKVIRYKKGIVRLALGAGWLAMVFGANYFIVGPLFEQANPIPEPPKPPPGFSTFNHDTVLRLPVIRPDHPVSSPHTDSINFLISDWLHIQPVILLAFLVIEGIAIAYFFLNAWAKSELIQTQLEANQLSTEIKFLKSQINPHFLFNT